MLIFSTLIILSSIAVAYRRDKSILYARIIIATIICCFFISLNSYYFDFLDKGIGLFNGLFHTTAITGVFHMFILIISGLILQLNGFFPRKVWINEYGSLSKIMLNKLVYYSSFILNKLSEQFRILEYPLIILFVIIGGTFLMSSSDLISIFLSIELQSYGLYILSTIYRNSERATSGGLTYFLLGALSSCFILLSSGLIYGNSGNTTYDGIFIINNISEMKLFSKDLIYNISSIWYESYYLAFSLIILSVGFLFKVSAAPFHFWSPDVYDAIPTIVTTFVAVFAKISIFILLLELVYYTNNLTETQDISELSASNVENLESHYVKNSSNLSWTFTLLISSLLSLIIGSILGLTQFRIKRLYAYSTISHIGFILLALTINTVESVQSFIFYLIQYSLANLNAFFLLISIGYCLYVYKKKGKNTDRKTNVNTQVSIEQTLVGTINLADKQEAQGENIVQHQQNKQDTEKDSKLTDKENSPIQLISQIKGFFYINPFISISLGLTLFSFIGIPPLIGFFAKQMILSSALDSGFIFITLIAILTSVISAYYYLVLIKQMFFFNSDYVINPKIKDLDLKANIISRTKEHNIKSINFDIKNISINGSLSLAISILTLIILLFILWPQSLLNLSSILAIILFNN